MNEMVSSVIISLVTGVISGLLSGWIVTRYYRNIDHKNEESKEKSQNLNAFNNYLNELLIETELAEKSEDYSGLYRIIRKKTDYIFEVYSVIGKSSQEIFHKVESKLHNIEQGIEKKTISTTDIKVEIRSIFILMLEVMAQSMSENCNK